MGVTRVLFGILIGAFVIGLIGYAIVAFYGNAPWNYAIDAMPQSLRSAIGVSAGQVLGGVNVAAVPEHRAARLAAIIASESARHHVTPGLEVVMTGSQQQVGGCLGGDKEIQIEVQNDIGADQIDVSYKMEADTLLAAGGIVTPSKVASCGKNSIIKQCIPLPAPGRNLGLNTISYYYGASSSDELSVVDSTVSPQSNSSKVREVCAGFEIKSEDLVGQSSISLKASDFTLACHA